MDPRQKILDFFKSFEQYEFPICDRDSDNWPLFSSLLRAVKRAGDNLRVKWPDRYIAMTMRGSYAHGHPYRGNDVDLLFIGENLTDEIRDGWLDIVSETLSNNDRPFALCEGRYEMGREIQPIRFLDLTRLPLIINTYLYGLESLMRRREVAEEMMLNYSPLTEKKRALLQSGILIPYMLWVHGIEKVPKVLENISRLIPVPTRDLKFYPESSIDELKETMRQTYIARTLTGRPYHLSLSTGFPIPFIEEEDYDSEVREEAEKLFKNIAPLRKIYIDAIRKHVVQAKLEMQLYGRRISPDRIIRFSPSYDEIVRRRIESPEYDGYPER